MKKKMTPDEFREIASGTRLKNKSWQAALLVFVEGHTQSEAGLSMGLSPVRMSQICEVINREVEKKERLESEQKGMVLRTGRLMEESYATAIKDARAVLGDATEMTLPIPNGRYVGEPIVRTDYHLVQSLGKEKAVVHDLSKLNLVPPLGKTVDIAYSRGRAMVQSLSRSISKGR